MTDTVQILCSCLDARRLLILAASAYLLNAGLAQAQLSNTIPESIQKQGLRVQIEDFLQLPDTRGTLGGKPDQQGGASARVNFLRDSPDGRLFANDLRGQIYTIDKSTGQLETFVDIDADNGGDSSIFPKARFQGGLSAGLISFALHPEYASNGVFYTIHTERAQDVQDSPDFETTDLRGPGFPTKWHTVVTEWDGADPNAPAWDEGSGARRELLRVGTTANSYFHPFGDLQFNPTATPGSDDYGLLYISGGDWGYINGAGAPQGSDADGQPGQLQRLDTLAGTLIRIDPRSPSTTGGIAGLGDYTIPDSNPFADSDPSTLGEIYALGFRNGHRMAWDADGTLFVSNVGSANIEEIERIVPGGNYGWADREGTFIGGADSSGNRDNVFPIDLTPEQDVDFRGQSYLYPTAQYDHDEGYAIAGGFVYQGTQVPALQGKFVFGDIVNGRIFAADVAHMKSLDITDPTTTAAVEEIQLFTRSHDGVETDVDLRSDFFGGGRVDLRFGQTNDGEIWLTTKTDGFVRRLVGDGGAMGLQAVVDRATGLVTLVNNSAGSIEIDGYTLASGLGGLRPGNGAWHSLEDQDYSGWEEAAPTSMVLSELNSEGSLAVPADGHLVLGYAYTGGEIAFGESLDDLTLEYRTPAGAVVRGAVVYSGENNSNNLQLLVDPQSGEATLYNGSSYPVTLTGYSVLSDSGALSPNGWQSLENQGLADWEEAAPTLNALSELVSTDGVEVASRTGYDLGFILAARGAEDLILEFLVNGEISPRVGVVSYQLRGDFNHDGTVDAADYTMWRDGSGQADGTGPIAGLPDGIVDTLDYLLWRDHYGATLLASQASPTTSTNAPAPGASALLAASVFAVASHWGRRGAALQILSDEESVRTP